MTVDRDTLTRLMQLRGMRPKDLAEATEGKDKVSEKTIRRALKGEVHPNENTARGLAKALGVEPNTLANPPDDKAKLQKLEQDAKMYRHTLRWRGEERLNLDLVTRHYNVDTDYIIKAAPLMFSLVAELCLAKRREDLDRAWEWKNSIPPHLQNASGVALNLMGEVLGAERESIASADLFGRHLLDSLDFYADSSAPVPFHDFLWKFAEETNDEAFRDVHLDLRGIDYEIFVADLDVITNGDSAAKLALENGRVRIRDIPEDLFHEGKAAERADWLKRHLTDDDLEWLDVIAPLSLDPNATEGTE